MTQPKTLVVRLERLPHRHAHIRVRNAFRQLQRMPIETKMIEVKSYPTHQIVQEKKS